MWHHRKGCFSLLQNVVNCTFCDVLQDCSHGDPYREVTRWSNFPKHGISSFAFGLLFSSN